LLDGGGRGANEGFGPNPRARVTRAEKERGGQIAVP